tara:strand:- start:1847 stop:2251 length:405 start_codon:yes stop_codon:yes gene_type:complete
LQDDGDCWLGGARLSGAAGPKPPFTATFTATFTAEFIANRTGRHKKTQSQHPDNRRAGTRPTNRAEQPGGRRPKTRRPGKPHRPPRLVFCFCRRYGFGEPPRRPATTTRPAVIRRRSAASQRKAPDMTRKRQGP